MRLFVFTASALSLIGALASPYLLTTDTCKSLDSSDLSRDLDVTSKPNSLISLDPRATYADRFRMFVRDSSPFTIAAANQCPNAFQGDAASTTTCCISAVAVVIIALIDGFAKSGSQSARNGQTPSRRSFILPFMDPDLSEHHYVTMTHVDGWEDANGRYWDQTLIEMIHKTTGESSFVTYGHQAERNHHLLSSAMDRGNHHRIGKRAGPDPATFYAYYAWSNENREIFKGRSTSDDEKNAAADSLYNYAHDNNVSTICADFQVNGQQANNGQFAITNGQFTPDPDQCA